MLDSGKGLYLYQVKLEVMNKSGRNSNRNRKLLRRSGSDSPPFLEFVRYLRQQGRSIFIYKRYEWIWFGSV